MSKTYEEWLKYYENYKKEQVIFDLWLNMQEIERLNNIINKAIEILENADYWDDIGNELLPVLKGSDKE